MASPKCDEQEPATAEFWRAVTYAVEWANGQTIEVEQPPLVAPPVEYRAA